MNFARANDFIVQIQVFPHSIMLRGSIRPCVF